MKLTYLNSASVLIEDNDVKILCDPWLDGEEYFGSWGIYPPYKFNPEKFQDVDFIYISHIHPDHCSSKTLSQLRKDIPVIIHNFPEKFLKNKIESLEFKVIEFAHNLRTRLKNNVHINILAADNCNPEICGKLMGCAFLEKSFETTQIDTMSVIDNEKEVIVNTNDCPYQIAENTAKIVKNQYQKIDMLLVGYVKASSYPQCFELDEKEKLSEAKIKLEKKLEQTVSYIKLFKPRYFMPFAGRYTLTGKNTHLNQYRGEPELEHAYAFLTKRIPQDLHKCIVLNHDSYFDITTGLTSDEFKPVDFNKKQEYIHTIFSKIKYDYEKEPKPSTDDLLKMIPDAYKNFELIRKRINWQSATTILLEISEDLIGAIACNGSGYKIIKKNEIVNFPRYLLMNLDSRLLKWLLQGPRKAHWSIADIGCHIKYSRVPNIYERGLYYCWNYFFSNIYS